jgi:hypothetical protein
MYIQFLSGKYQGDKNDMKKNRNNIIRYLNQCQNCHCSTFDNNSKLEIQSIKYKRAFENIIIMGVKNSEMEYFDYIFNKKNSIAIWNKIVGYQLEGYRILKEDEYCSEIEMFYNKSNLINSRFFLFISNILSTLPYAEIEVEIAI